MALDEILVRALDERADRYCEELANAFSPHSKMRRDGIVEKARLLVRCHDMWAEASAAIPEGE
jgi:hypothetical protein